LRAMVLASEQITLKMIAISLMYFLLFFAITLFFSIIILFLVIKVYHKATTTLDEMEELRNNNMAVAVMMSMIVLGITFFVRPSLSRFIASMVHYDRIEMISTGDEEDSGKKKEGELIVPMKKIEPKGH